MFFAQMTMGVLCLCGLLFLIKTCEAHLVQEIGKGSTANVQCTFTNNLCFFSCSSSSISTCVDKEPVQCAGCHHITSSLIHDSLSRAKIIWKQHIPKRGFPRSDRTKMIDRIFMLHFPRHLCRAAFTILKMLVLLHALSPPEKS